MKIINSEMQRQNLSPTAAEKKQKEFICLPNFNLILKILSDENKTGHLFLVDMKFNEKLTDEKVLLFNEVYRPLFEKKLLGKPYERPVLQLLTVLQRSSKYLLNTFKFNNLTKKLIRQ